MRALVCALIFVAGTFSGTAQGTNWQELFTGKDLDGWITNDFAGHGEVRVEDGRIVIGTGVALTGIKRKEAPFKSNYEVQVEAMRIDGGDFFCGLTFPVKDSHATLIIGGWGGSLVGFSSVDGMDASENEFTQYMRFDEKKWYTIRLRVTDTKIQAWINNERMIDADIRGRKISMRAGEIEDSAPFGIATFQTTAAIKSIKVRATPDRIPRIAMISGKKSHGPGEHEYKKALQLLAKQLDKEHEFIDVRVFYDGWPTDDEALRDAHAIVLYSDGADKNQRDHPLLLGGRMNYLDELFNKGAGLVFLHYSVIVPREKAGENLQKWIGGFFDFESGNTPNKWYSKIETDAFQVHFPQPEHPILRGVKPFKLNEEYYFNLRLGEKERVTPLITLDPEKKDWAKVVGIANEAPNGSRGFGYTGGHFYKNFEDPNVQRLLLNAILWTAKADSYISKAK
jgi:hypothetical protein